MSTKNVIATSSVPVSVLTPSAMLKYESFIKARPVLKKNKYGGKYIDMHLDDGKSPNRKVEIELTDIYSRFGIGSMKDEKTGKESWSIAFPMQHPKNSGDLHLVAEIADRVAQREVCLHYEKLFNEKKSELVLQERCQSCAKLPQKPENAAQYGANFKVSMYDKGVRFFTNGKEVTRDDIKGKEGRYTLQFGWDRIYFMQGNVYGQAFKLKHILYEPEQEEEVLFTTKNINLNPSSSSSSAASSTSATISPSEGSDASDEPAPVASPSVPDAHVGNSMSSSSSASASDPAPSSSAVHASAPPAAAIGSAPPGGASLDSSEMNTSEADETRSNKRKASVEADKTSKKRRT